MKILVSTQKLIVGGANVTALDLATELRRRGHDVDIFAEPGPMREGLAERGLGYHQAPADASLHARWPSGRTVLELRRVARRIDADVVHTYEWSACLNALLGAHLVDGTPLVASVMAMRVPRFMPRRVPLVVGTRVLHDELRRQGFADVTLVEPPVDVDADEPSYDGGPFRQAHGLTDTALVLAIVSRLDALKNESTFMAIDAVERMANTGTDIRLVIAGGGSAAEAVHRRADEVNGRIGRSLVVMTGVLDDPRGAYAAADVVLGMGGSALRGLAFAKPLIVVGTEGYAELFTPETSGEFLVQGFWGLGEGDHRPDGLIAMLEGLASDQPRREQLGAFGRRFVCERFSLTEATTRLEAVLEAAAGGTTPTAQRGVEAASAMSKLATIRLQAWVRRGGGPVSR